jgi:hypothetical protein
MGCGIVTLLDLIVRDLKNITIFDDHTTYFGASRLPLPLSCFQ